MKKYTELIVEILHQTTSAVKIKIDGGDECWVPWSLIENNGEDFKNGYKGKMYVETWFAENELGQ